MSEQRSSNRAPEVDPAALPAYRPAQRARLGDQLYEQILHRIVSGEYPEGHRLPAEKELSEVFQVSRSVVREALFRLQVDGLVAARQGSGTFVLLRPSSEFFENAPPGEIADVLRFFELRIALEGEAAFYAAQRRTAADLALIRSINDRLEQTLETREVGVDLDIELHQAIATATHNDLFGTTLKTLRTLFEAGLRMTRGLSLKKQNDRLRLVQDEHQAIISAIAEANPDRARTAMRHHIDNARTRLVSGARVP